MSSLLGACLTCDDNSGAPALYFGETEACIQELKAKDALRDTTDQSASQLNAFRFLSLSARMLLTDMPLYKRPTSNSGLAEEDFRQDVA